MSHDMEIPGPSTHGYGHAINYILYSPGFDRHHYRGTDGFERFLCRPGGTYCRFRLINTAMMYAFRISVDQVLNDDEIR